MNNFTKMAEEWMRQHRAPAAGAGRPKPALPEVDPSAWSEDLHRWLLEQCVYRDRCFNGIWALHRDFCEWVIAHDGVPCHRPAFEQLLHGCGFLSADGMVYGLMLRVDFVQLEYAAVETL